MKKSKIGLFDSGIGGLTVLSEIKKLLPNEDYIYYADSLHNPYGSKDSNELLKITSNIVDYLISNNVKLIVIACNTATTVCMKELKDKYKDIIFVGVVPAIKVAYDQNSHKTLVLATPYTVKSKRVDELVATYKHLNQEITLVPCHNLANAIETKSGEEIEEVLKEQIKKYLNQNYDTIVLGCTHYSIIRNMIKRYFPNSQIIDGNIGVAKEVKRQLELNDLISIEGSGSTEFFNSLTEDDKDYLDILNRIKE